jgi:hypothetical protein
MCYLWMFKEDIYWPFMCRDHIEYARKRFGFHRLWKLALGHG